MLKMNMLGAFAVRPSGRVNTSLPIGKSKLDRVAPRVESAADEMSYAREEAKINI